RISPRCCSSRRKRRASRSSPRTCRSRTASRSAQIDSGGESMADGSTTTWKGGTEHWTTKGDVKLFLWNKKRAPATKDAGTILFVHGSSMASQPTFDLAVPGRADSSAMDYFASLGYDTWTMDNEGYGRSDKHRAQNNDISNGAHDLAPGSRYILAKSGGRKLLVYGISSGALKAA